MRKTGDALRPQIIYDNKTNDYVVFGRQPTFKHDGVAPELFRTKDKKEAKDRLRQAEKEDVGQVFKPRPFQLKKKKAKAPINTEEQPCPTK